MKPLLSMAEAAEVAQMDPRKLLRILKALPKEDEVLMKGEGQRVHMVKREALKRALDLTEADFAIVKNHEKRLEDHERRILDLEATYDLLQPSK